jgi:ferredoxin
MIIASQKPVDEIRDTLKTYPKILIAACGTCVTVCLAGGEKEAKELAALLGLESDAEYRVVCAERQCDSEFLETIDADVRWADAVLSLGCGVGVQFMGERYEADAIPVIPGLNTTFMGANRDAGYWTEMCQGCGNCILEKTGGICPVSRCSKSHFNGPCGGSHTGKCEINDETDCAWQLIYERLKRIGQLDRLYEINEARDWSTSRDGGPRRLVRGDVKV